MRILFVCLGNICRSPMAEGIMKSLARKNNLDWYIDSAATESYHIGAMPDRRAIATCKRHGIDIDDQRARKLTANDLEAFDLIYALADEVMQEIRHDHKAAAGNRKLQLLLDELFPGEQRSVPDPYYGNEEGFEPVFQLIKKGCEAVLHKYGTAGKQG